nr:PREDICTED: uncharacterized protein LOC103312896 [Tribolium castaneum]|eukprot:XP_015835604.1 PREDICTED: uncharacterized protein LOC103312896 [Tribolium castaneum]
MRKLIVATCLITLVWGYHVKTQDFDVAIESIEFTKIPAKYNLNFANEEVLKEIIGGIKRPKSGTEAILNEYADKIFQNIQNLMIHGGFDPIEMPDMHTGFNYTLIITYHGELDLTHGWLSDLSTIHRSGDVVVSYSSNTKYLEITVPIAFDDLQFTYDYSAKIMGLGPTGGIEGKANSVGVRVKIGFNVETLEASLDEFSITNSGRITFHFNGNALIDWLLNLLTDVTTILLKRVILLVVENVIKGGLSAAIDAINEVINGFLNPTTPVPDTTPALLYYK